MEVLEITNGISNERLLEICEAERKSKLVILPDVNIGDKVFTPYHDDYGEHWVYSETIDGYQVFGNNTAKPCADSVDEGLCEIEEYYTSREEAERIAKERADKAPKRGTKRGGGVSLKKMNEALTSVYAKAVIEQLNQPDIFAKITKNGEEKLIGKDFTIPLHYDR